MPAGVDKTTKASETAKSKSLSNNIDTPSKVNSDNDDNDDSDDDDDFNGSGDQALEF